MIKELENYVPKPKPLYCVHVMTSDITEDTLKHMSLTLSDSLGRMSIADGERIRGGQLVVVVGVDRDEPGPLWLKMFLTHESRVPEIASAVYRHDLRPHSSLWHAADFLETRDWASVLPDIIKSIHG